ncbi:hypothetical protein LCGC14_1332980 [marine sediment metagenome]|uniref:HNH nuclease domain-containing protein n=1 Tax=marine sediment metagenome TaxID=412755 RepID=A0A0F9KGQ7_9ZZZZ
MKKKCKDCKKKTSRGHKRCQSCANRKTSKGRTCSKETRSKIRNAQKGRLLTEKHKKQLRLNHVDMSNKNNPFYGKKHTKETLRKQSLSHGGTGVPHENDGYITEWNYLLKAKIRKRDNYTCQICNIKEKDCYRELDIHHIDYDKQNLDFDNLISLCQSCHMKTNFNRDYWKEYFYVCFT